MQWCIAPWHIVNVPGDLFMIQALSGFLRKLFAIRLIKLLPLACLAVAVVFLCAD